MGSILSVILVGIFMFLVMVPSGVSKDYEGGMIWSKPEAYKEEKVELEININITTQNGLKTSVMSNCIEKCYEVGNEDNMGYLEENGIVVRLFLNKTINKEIVCESEFLEKNCWAVFEYVEPNLITPETSKAFFVEDLIVNEKENILYSILTHPLFVGIVLFILGRLSVKQKK